MTAAPSFTENHVTPQQLAVWRMFLRIHANVVRRLEADLQERHGLPLAWYEVLVQLVEAEGHRLRMSELADRVMLSPSGLTRLAGRMADEGLVERVQAEGDGRGYYAVLTDAGYRRLREASGTHLRGIHDYVVGRFSEDELRRIESLFSRMLDDDVT